MDRDDVRFCADVLAGRIAGDREGLERAATSSLMRISTLATLLRKRADGWRPALTGAAELMAICRYGGNVVDHAAPVEDLQKLVDSLRRVDEAEPPPPNRRARRREISRLPREERRNAIVAGRPGLVH